MKKVKDGKNVEQPALEIFVSVEGLELCTVAFFPERPGVWAALVGIEDQAMQSQIADALHFAAAAVLKASFRPLDAAFDEGSGLDELIQHLHDDDVPF